MLFFVCFVIFWLSSATLSAGYYHGYVRRCFKDETSRHDDLAMSWLYSLILGPMAWIMSFLLCEFWRYGWLNPFKIDWS